MDQKQAMTILKKMDSSCYIESLKQFLSDPFVDDISIENQETSAHNAPMIGLGFELRC